MVWTCSKASSCYSNYFLDGIVPGSRPWLPPSQSVHQHKRLDQWILQFSLSLSVSLSVSLSLSLCLSFSLSLCTHLRNELTYASSIALPKSHTVDLGTGVRKCAAGALDQFIAVRARDVNDSVQRSQRPCWRGTSNVIKMEDRAEIVADWDGIKQEKTRETICVTLSFFLLHHRYRDPSLSAVDHES